MSIAVKLSTFVFYYMYTTTSEHFSTVQILFDADNINTNVGQHNLIKSRALTENKSLFITSCNCHLVHTTACQGRKAFENIFECDIEEHQVNIYYYFKKSMQRKRISKDYFELVDEEWNNIIQLVSTTQFSLELCCNKGRLQISFKD